MEPEWQSSKSRFSPNMVDFLTDAELAFALQEEELSRLSNTSIQQSRPSSPSSLGTELYGDLQKADVTKECQVCAEEKHINLYPQSSTESDCRCLSDVCRVCMMQHISSQIESKESKEGSLTCPMCNRPLVPHEIEEYADSYTFKTYLSHMIDRTVKDMPNFTRCPNADCNSGQVHEGGDAHPFVTCAACKTQFCFRHGIPTQPRPEQQGSSQHENMTCDEYDRYLADPINFISDHQRQQERAAVERREEEAVVRARERMDKILERRREAAAAAAAAADEIKKRKEERVQRQNVARLAREHRQREQRQSQVELRERRERQQRQSQVERRERREREAREERARLEARRYAEERERAERERKVRAEEVLRRKMEDENSEKWIEVETKGCPGCGNRIEKNQGCMHMTCHCGCEFCWVCTGPWVANSCANCFGGPVVQFE